jgi:hypothetical protein
MLKSQNQKADYYSSERIREESEKNQEFKEEIKKIERRVISEFLKVKVNAITTLFGIKPEDGEYKYKH